MVFFLIKVIPRGIDVNIELRMVSVLSSLLLSDLISFFRLIYPLYAPAHSHDVA
jgi:hypothetical protein